MRGPGRREIGHGHLAERALIPVLPSKDEFPYVIRLVSECVTSNGSTSMASTCGSTLALMDAGVPISAPVAGAAMGLMSEPDGSFAVLTDILGKEDAFGDMDFKVTGTRDGITALQMDIKVKGINEAIIREGLAKAHAARMTILDKMTEVLPSARDTMSDFAPRITKIKINPEKIRDIIGKGGSMIRKIQEETGTEINVEDDGTVEIAAVQGENARKAIHWIESLTREVEIGALYLGKVTRIMGFGAFVEILPGKEGLVRIGELADYHVPVRRGRRVRRRRGDGRRHRDRPPGPRQPLPQGGHAAAPRQGVGPAAAAAGRVTHRARPRESPGALLYSGACPPSTRALKAEPCPDTPPDPLTVAVVGATGVVGRTMATVLLERGFPIGELRLPRLGALGRHDPAVRRPPGRGAGGDARGLRRRRHRPLLGRRRHVARAGAARGRPRLHGHRQLQRLAHGAGHPARREPGQPGRPRGPRGDHRQPQLLHDAARAAAHGAARRRRPRAGRRRHLPGGLRHRRQGDRRAGDADPGPRRRRAAKEARVYPHPIAFNALPEIDVFLDNGYTKEEWKVVTESRKILHLPDLRVSCTAVRVPVFVSHSEAVHVETRDPITPDAARELFAAVPGVVVRDDPATHVYPLATDAAGSDEIFVGRVRTDPSIPDGRGLAFWVRLGQHPQGRRDERRGDRRGARRARLGPRGVAARRGGHARVTEAERRAALEAIAAEVRICTRCRLHEGRTKAVPGEGHPSTEVVFVGEGPGMNEDRQGRPFVGRAGDLLVQLLASIGWRRDDVFITNVVKCRPPDNRDPEPDEIAACAPYLRRQLEVLDPALVVTLGRHSMARFMPGTTISRAHGTVRPADPATGARDALVFAMYHPAAALRTTGHRGGELRRHGAGPGRARRRPGPPGRRPAPRPPRRRRRPRHPPGRLPPRSRRRPGPGRVPRPSRAGATGRGPADSLPVTR